MRFDVLMFSCKIASGDTHGVQGDATDMGLLR